MRMFEPIITMLNRLKYVQKFSVMILVFGIPVILISILYMQHLNKEIHDNELRQKGAYYNVLLKDLLKDTQKYRGFSVSYLSGNDYFEKALEWKKASISEQISNIERYQSIECATLLTEKVDRLRKDWETIQVNHLYNKDIYDVMYIQNAYIEVIGDLMEEVSSHTNLVLTDSDYTYYIVNDVTNNLPNLTEQFGKIRGYGMALIGNGEVTEEDRLALSKLVSTAEEALQKLKKGKEIAYKRNPTLQQTFGTDTQSVIDHGEAFLLFIEDNFLTNEHIRISYEEYYVQATATIDLAFTLFDREVKELNRMMDKQHQSLKVQRVFMFFIIAFSLLLTTYCLVGLYHSIKKSVEEIATKGNLLLYEYFFFPLIQNAEKKYAASEKKLREVTKSSSYQVLHAQEEERKRVSRELHDGISQTLYSILVTLSFTEEENATKTNRENIEKAKKLTVKAMDESRKIAKSLRPSILDELGLITAIKSHLEEFEEAYRINVHFELTGEKRRLDPEIETAIFRTGQEALMNVAKHAKASRVNISFKYLPNLVHIHIADNGIGFNYNHYLNDHHCKGIGLFSMKERIIGVNGTINIYSKCNQGTTIEISVPQ